MLKVEEFEAADVESLKLGRDADKLAVVVDPTGYCWEVLERHEKGVLEPLCKVGPCFHSQVLHHVISLSCRVAVDCYTAARRGSAKILQSRAAKNGVNT